MQLRHSPTHAACALRDNRDASGISGPRCRAPRVCAPPGPTSIDEATIARVAQRSERAGGRRSVRLNDPRMKIEPLCFDGCPDYEAFVPRLAELLAPSGADADVELRAVETPAAEREGFLGSPTVRVDGQDVDCGVSAPDFGLKCRLDETPGGLPGALRRMGRRRSRGSTHGDYR